MNSDLTPPTRGVEDARPTRAARLLSCFVVLSDKVPQSATHFEQPSSACISHCSCSCYCADCHLSARTVSIFALRIQAPSLILKKTDLTHRSSSARRIDKQHHIQHVASHESGQQRGPIGRSAGRCSSCWHAVYLELADQATARTDARPRGPEHNKHSCLQERNHRFPQLHELTLRHSLGPSHTATLHSVMQRLQREQNRRDFILRCGVPLVLRNKCYAFDSRTARFLADLVARGRFAVAEQGG